MERKPGIRSTSVEERQLGKWNEFPVSVPSGNGATPRVLVFGGTTEGRELATWLGERGGCQVVVSSLTEYGGSLVEDIPNVTSLTGRMLPDDMERLMRDESFACVVDATHPYAAGVSESIAGAAGACGVPLLRVLRESEPEGPWEGVDSPAEAAQLIAQKTGPVMLTTGSKDLPLYVAAVPDFAERLYARILPVASSLAAADELSIPTSHIIAMQGPFSKELNMALIREFGIRTLVTKASGAAGGFWEKVEAAQECGCDLVVIHRPLDEEGLSMDQAKQAIVHYLMSGRMSSRTVL